MAQDHLNDLLTPSGIALFVIAICLLLLTLRFAFNSSFRNDVIAGEGETKVLGVLSAKGTLILVLLLGLVGALIVLSTNFPSEKPALSEKDIHPDASDWYAINREGEIIRPKISLSRSSIVLGIDPDHIEKTGLFDNNELKLYKSSGALLLKKNGLTWGYLDKAGLDSLFFNGFQTIESNKLPDSYYDFIKFTKSKNRWSPNSHDFFNAFTIYVKDTISKTMSKTIYSIVNNKTGQTVFSSLNNGNVIDAGEDENHKSNRIFHLYKYNGDFYLFRIMFANLNEEKPGYFTNKNPYIEFFGIKLRPTYSLP